MVPAALGVPALVPWLMRSPSRHHRDRWWDMLDRGECRPTLSDFIVDISLIQIYSFINIFFHNSFYICYFILLHVSYPFIFQGPMRHIYHKVMGFHGIRGYFLYEVFKNSRKEALICIMSHTCTYYLYL